MFYSKLHRYVAVSAALFVATSCSDGSGIADPISPLTRTDAVASARGNHGKREHVLKRESRLRDAVSASATITPEGGVLQLPEAGLLMYFPPGAVARTTVVSAKARRGNHVVYDFQPHGLTFSTPIYVAQSLAYTELSSARARAKRPYVSGAYLSNGEADLFADGSATLAEIFDTHYSGTDGEMLAVFATTHFSGYVFVSGVVPIRRSE